MSSRPHTTSGGSTAVSKKVTFSHVSPYEEEGNDVDLELDDPDFDDEIGSIRGGPLHCCHPLVLRQRCLDSAFRRRSIFTIIVVLLVIICVASWRLQWFQQAEQEMLDSPTETIDDSDILRDENGMPLEAPALHISPKRTTKGPATVEEPIPTTPLVGDGMGVAGESSVDSPFSTHQEPVQDSRPNNDESATTAEVDEEEENDSATNEEEPTSEEAPLDETTTPTTTDEPNAHTPQESDASANHEEETSSDHDTPADEEGTVVHQESQSHENDGSTTTTTTTTTRSHTESGDTDHHIDANDGDKTHSPGTDTTPHPPDSIDTNSPDTHAAPPPGSISTPDTTPHPAS